MDLLLSSFQYLGKGALQTLGLAALTLMLGSSLGFFLGVVGHVAPGPLRWLIAAYVFAVRGTPILVLIFLAYFGVPQLKLRIPDYLSACGALVIYASALIAELTRGSLASIPRAQVESAKSLGLRRLQIVRLVSLPQAWRHSLPALCNTIVYLIKATAYVSVVGVWELTYAAREIAERTLAPLPIYFAVMLFYVCLCYPFAHLARALEKPVGSSP